MQALPIRRKFRTVIVLGFVETDQLPDGLSWRFDENGHFLPLRGTSVMAR